MKFIPIGIFLNSIVSMTFNFCWGVSETLDMFISFISEVRFIAEVLSVRKKALSVCEASHAQTRKPIDL